MKLRFLSLHNTKDVPDHIMQECHDLARKMYASMLDASVGVDPNIFLGALNFIHAISLIENVDPSCLDQGTKLAAITLIKNVEFFSKMPMKDEDIL